MHVDEIHQIAENFLKEHQKGLRMNYVHEKVETSALEVTNLVLLKKSENPPYFYGFKPSGRPIFTHDMKIAKAFGAGSPEVTAHITRLEALGIPVEQHLTIWREGRTV